MDGCLNDAMISSDPSRSYDASNGMARPFAALVLTTIVMTIQESEAITGHSKKYAFQGKLRYVRHIRKSILKSFGAVFDNELGSNEKDR